MKQGVSEERAKQLTEGLQQNLLRESGRTKRDIGPSFEEFSGSASRKEKFAPSGPWQEREHRQNERQEMQQNFGVGAQSNSALHKAIAIARDVTYHPINPEGYASSAGPLPIAAPGIKTQPKRS